MIKAVVQSATIEGFSVVMWPGICHVSFGYYHATLEYVNEHHCVRDSRGAGLTVTPHQLLMIKQWAKAHGYTKERRRAKTTNNIRKEPFYGGSTAEEFRQLALSLEIPAAKARRRARAG